MVALAAGLGLELALLYALSNALTDGGAHAGPRWLPGVLTVAVLVVAVPAVIIGLRSRRADPSVLGTIALVVACLIGGWVALTGVAHLFIE